MNETGSVAAITPSTSYHESLAENAEKVRCFTPTARKNRTDLLPWHPNRKINLAAVSGLRCRIRLTHQEERQPACGVSFTGGGIMSAYLSGCAVCVALLLQPAFAASISFTGNLRTDATVLSCGNGCTLGAGNSDGDFAQYAAVVRDFTVATPSAMQGLSFSYGGGINGEGTIILEGGFQPYLSLFDAGGNFLASTFFGTTCPTGANINTLSGQCYDVLLDGGVLAAGNYQIALTAFQNLSFAENLGAGTLADGFTGLGNLFEGEDLHYAFDVILSPVTAIPEPATSALTIFALLGIYLIARKHKGKVHEN
jgi:hypothetical protein